MRAACKSTRSMCKITMCVITMRRIALCIRCEGHPMGWFCG